MGVIDHGFANVAATTQGDARFRADPPEARRSVSMEGMDIVFHRPSGITHILATPAPELIALISDRALCAAEIVERLGFAQDEAAAALSLVRDRLAELEAAGLVRRT